jgi:hypothetical protein
MTKRVIPMTKDVKIAVKSLASAISTPRIAPVYTRARIFAAGAVQRIIIAVEVALVL